MSQSGPDQKDPSLPPKPPRHVALITLAVAAAILAASHIFSDLDSAVVWLPRVGITITAVALIMWAIAVQLSRRVSRQMAQNTEHMEELIARFKEEMDERITARLKDARYAEAYVAGLRRRPPDDDYGQHLHAV